MLPRFQSLIEGFFISYEGESLHTVSSWTFQSLIEGFFISYIVQNA